jgi:ppGpp synthetase/RelA/SpoT-type nucleotidyltranferase
MNPVDEFKLLSPAYSSFQEEVIMMLNALRSKHSATVDSYDVDGRIKDIASIEQKMNRSNGKYPRVVDLPDIAGARVICLCMSDLDRFDTILQEELKKSFPSFTREVIEHDSGYRGVHYTVSKEFDISGKKERLHCEIQLRTVLQDAWSILSHRYGYKKKTEGDSDTLKQVVSGILANCENLWELVKKSTKSDEQISDEEASLIYQDTSIGVESAQEALSLGDMDKLVSGNKTVQVEEFLDQEIQRVKALWAELYLNKSTPQAAREDALTMLDAMEHALNPILVVGLLAIKHNRIALLRKVLDKFGIVASLTDLQQGYTVLLSVPAASLHNAYYYLGTYALLKVNAEAEHLLITFKMELQHNGQLYYDLIWEDSSIFAPEVIHGASYMFDHLKNDYQNNDSVKDLLKVTHEEFLDLACEFNLIFCMKSAMDEEEGHRTWGYPNFGRFYPNRVMKLLQRIRNREEYQQFVAKVMSEDATAFLAKFNGRIAILQARSLGSGYVWQSIRGLKDE